VRERASRGVSSVCAADSGSVLRAVSHPTQRPSTPRPADKTPRTSKDSTNTVGGC
jgi:hypothetical protein